MNLHLALDHDGYLPQFAVLTGGRTPGIEVARRQRFGPGTMRVFDRGYTAIDWWWELSRQNVFFLARLKDNIAYGVVESRPVAAGKGLPRDEVVLLVKIQEAGPTAVMRRVEVWDNEHDRTVVFLGNHLSRRPWRKRT